MPIPNEYEERVYAGMLGKIIGVYLGRRVEGWSHERIMAELGEIAYYVHEQRNVPLIVTDDDISGTFTFLRALPDYGNNRDLTPEQIGQTWLNYIVDGRTILWWGGLGNSTEHAAYLRLKDGIPAPRSGSIALNGKVMAEQIGAQIFIDGWAMVVPGDSALAANLARRAASVSHDGEVICAAKVLAAMEAQAFVESEIDKLIDTGISVIPRTLVIYHALLLCDGGTARLVKALDGETVLAETSFSWTFGGTYELSLQVVGTRLWAAVDGAVLFDVEDTDDPLTGGGVALICEEGRMSTDAVTVRPAAPVHTGEEALP